MVKKVILGLFVISFAAQLGASDRPTPVDDGRAFAGAGVGAGSSADAALKDPYRVFPKESEDRLLKEHPKLAETIQILNKNSLSPEDVAAALSVPLYSRNTSAATVLTLQINSMYKTMRELEVERDSCRSDVVSLEGALNQLALENESLKRIVGQFPKVVEGGGAGAGSGVVGGEPVSHGRSRSLDAWARDKDLFFADVDAADAHEANTREDLS